MTSIVEAKIIPKAQKHRYSPVRSQRSELKQFPFTIHGGNMSLLVLIDPLLTCFHGEIPQLPRVKPKASKSVFLHEHVIVYL